MKPVDLDKVSAACDPVIASHGYELVDLEWKTEAKAWVLRIFIDKPGGDGRDVSLDVCADISRELSTVLDVADLIGPAYSLEVSSPGLDRPVRHERDFARFVGRKAKVRTRHPVTGASGEPRRNFSGVLVGVAAGKVKIDVGDREFEVPVDDVEKANLVYEF